MILKHFYDRKRLISGGSYYRLCFMNDKRDSSRELDSLVLNVQVIIWHAVSVTISLSDTICSYVYKYMLHTLIVTLCMAEVASYIIVITLAMTVAFIGSARHQSFNKSREAFDFLPTIFA